MLRRFTVSLVCVWLFSFLAIDIGPAPAQAATIYDFTATPSPYLIYWSSFSLQYVDADGDGLLNQSEVVPGSFSGVQYSNYLLPSWIPTTPTGWSNFPELVAVPCWGPVFDYGPNGEINGGLYWSFGSAIGQGTDYLPPGSPGLWVVTEQTGWTYSQTPVPVPPSALLLGSGLLGLAGWRRFRKS